MAELEISSAHNPRVKLAARLRDGRQRQRQERIVIDGAREVICALRGGLPLAEAFVCRELCRSDDSRQALALLKARDVDVLHVTPAIWEKLAYGERADGILAIGPTPERTLDDLTLPERPLVAVLEGIEKPGNIGAVLRSADGAGASAMIVADGRTDLFNPNAIRASLGTIFSVPVAEASSTETLAWLRRGGLRIFAARVDAATDYTAADFRGPAAIVLGSESSGLSAAWHSSDVTPIKLPMHGAADSLNVSATAAVLLYEALRQRAGDVAIRL